MPLILADRTSWKWFRDLIHGLGLADEMSRVDVHNFGFRRRFKMPAHIWGSGYRQSFTVSKAGRAVDSGKDFR